MKTYFTKKTALIVSLLILATAQVLASTVEEENANPDRKAVKILVVPLPDNVSSNYFPDSFITQETGIPSDSIDYAYNQVITRNLMAANKNGNVLFVSSKSSVSIEDVIGKLQLQGEEEEMYADLSQVDSHNYGQLMRETDTDYVLFLNQHYLKWQEKPLRTLFHITTYSLYDKNQKEVTHGNTYFTSMNLENQDKLSRDSKKSSSKIATNVIKCLNVPR